MKNEMKNTTTNNNELNWKTLRDDLRKTFGKELDYYNDLNKSHRRIKIYHTETPSFQSQQYDKTSNEFMETTILPYMTKVWDYINVNYPTLDKQKHPGYQIVLKFSK